MEESEGYMWDFQAVIIMFGNPCSTLVDTSHIRLEREKQRERVKAAKREAAKLLGQTCSEDSLVSSEEPGCVAFKPTVIHFLSMPELTGSSINIHTMQFKSQLAVTQKYACVRHPDLTKRMQKGDPEIDEDVVGMYVSLVVHEQDASQAEAEKRLHFFYKLLRMHYSPRAHGNLAVLCHSSQDTFEYNKAQEPLVQVLNRYMSLIKASPSLLLGATNDLRKFVGPLSLSVIPRIERACHSAACKLTRWLSREWQERQQSRKGKAKTALPERSMTTYVLLFIGTTLVSSSCSAWPAMSQQRTSRSRGRAGERGALEVGIGRHLNADEIQCIAGYVHEIVGGETENSLLTAVGEGERMGEMEPEPESAMEESSLTVSGHSLAAKDKLNRFRSPSFAMSPGEAPIRDATHINTHMPTPTPNSYMSPMSPTVSKAQFMRSPAASVQMAPDHQRQPSFNLYIPFTPGLYTTCLCHASRLDTAVVSNPMLGVSDTKWGNAIAVFISADPGRKVPPMRKRRGVDRRSSPYLTDIAQPSSKDELLAHSQLISQQRGAVHSLVSSLLREGIIPDTLNQASHGSALLTMRPLLPKLPGVVYFSAVSRPSGAAFVPSVSDLPLIPMLHERGGPYAKRGVIMYACPYAKRGVIMDELAQTHKMGCDALYTGVTQVWQRGQMLLRCYCILERERDGDTALRPFTLKRREITRLSGAGSWLKDFDGPASLTETLPTRKDRERERDLGKQWDRAVMGGASPYVSDSDAQDPQAGNIRELVSTTKAAFGSGSWWGLFCRAGRGEAEAPREVWDI
ncbi:hypothetical protein KIPB_005466 [Kipferlia bialata]|uniref:Uncharacterized protein n=1 Tax=Kipferlia bialata TaxID=797122 RepID=A0A9K3CXH2_9EUKA|nr:hypothetical protein KIPB_005466 [Kipferlia bialata]|eukprot:g5466.t1